MKKTLIFGTHFAALLAGCALIALAVFGLEVVGLPRELGPTLSFVFAMPLGAFILRRAASVDRSGEADETSTKIEGSAEGESAVPKADAQ